MLKAVCIGGVIASLFGCAGAGTRSCAPGYGQPVLVFDLFFGKAIPGRGDLTEREWLQFLDDTIAVNLPNGFTVFDAAGGWMDPVTRRTTREAAKVLLTALPDAPASLEAVDRVRSAYQIRFRQQLVGMTVDPECGSF
nr:DUF3574 domain-containing protein [uncultured Rhodopila sp.]